MRISESKLRVMIRQAIKEGSSDQVSLDEKLNQVLESKIKLNDFIKTTIGDTNRQFYENVYARACFAEYEKKFEVKLSNNERAHIRKSLRDLMKRLIERGHAGY
tara:strand:- start:114 stop:425 length:312 start_codon:yes stop_codon:yes gene_type:complete